MTNQILNQSKFKGEGNKPNYFIAFQLTGDK